MICTCRKRRNSPTRWRTSSTPASYDDLVIVAPARTLAAIREKLTAATEAKIIGTLPKDLVRTPDKDLWPHIGDWVKPLHRPVAPD